MQKSIAWVVKRETDSWVVRGLERLLAEDRERKADLLAFLGEADRRKLYAKAGYSSLFRWLTEKYFMSESSALKRIQAARLATRFPFLIKSVAQGDYSLSVLSRLSPFVNGKNGPLFFKAALKKSVREVEAFLITQFPKDEVADKIGKPISPLRPGRHHVQFTAGEDFLRDFKKAQALLSHKMPKGKLEDVLGHALKILIQQLEKPARKAKACPAAPETGKPVPPRSRYIPRGMQVEVRERDQNICQHKRPDGSLCGATHFLEIDHILPYALGGRHAGENLRLLCWAHNALRAESSFGKRGWPKRPPL